MPIPIPVPTARAASSDVPSSAGVRRTVWPVDVFFMEAKSARPGLMSLNPWATVTTRIRSPGRARNKPLKPLRGECRLNPSGPVVTTLVCFLNSHARLRVQRAPGIPCALCYRGTRFVDSSGASRRENADSYPRLFEN